MLLALAKSLPLTGILLLAALAGLMWVLLRAASPRDARSDVDIIFPAALLIFTLEILLVQGFPQWAEERPDATLYHLQAQALVRHWYGETVPVAEFRLRGLLSLGIAEWRPDDAYPYHMVLGMGRNFYQLFVAGIYALTDGSVTVAILSNAVFLAGAAVAAYLLSMSLFGMRLAAALAVLLIVVDTNFAVVGSVLLRDALIVLLVLSGLLGGVRLWRCEGDSRTQWVLLVVSATGLAVVRFNALAALAIAAATVTMARHRRLVFGRLGLSLVAGGLVAVTLIRFVPALNAYWQESLPGRVVEENLEILVSGTQVLSVAAGGESAGAEASIDSARAKWRSALRENPWWLNLGTAVAKTFLAPNPWHVVKHGFSGRHFFELMIPGTALWILLMPFFFFALWRLYGRKDPAVSFCLVWLFTVALFYIIGYGEFSGRIRVMGEPLLWIFVAYGIASLNWINSFLVHHKAINPDH